MEDNIATWQQIVNHFTNLPDLSGNWGTSFDNSKWDVTAKTYINGIMLTIDCDFEMGYLIEVVDRTSGQLSYGVIVNSLHGVLSHQYEQDAGIFFQRNIDNQSISSWGVQEIYRLLKSSSKLTQVS